MIILGLDIASVTGFAWYEPGSSLSSIKTGLIKATGENAEEKAASLAVQLVAMFKQGRPDFVAIETPMRNVKSFTKKRQDFGGEVEEQTINPNALQLSSLAGAAVAIIAAYRIQWECIPSQTWRKVFLGAGRMPGRDRAGWKRAAIDRCRMLRIDVKNADAAEAVGIAYAGEHCQAFKMERARRAEAERAQAGEAA
jgi:Holliday junction resolvasome RuvABC endonuclease subunit